MPVTRIVFGWITRGDDEERRKKILDRQCNPMYAQGVRTFMNSSIPAGDMIVTKLMKHSAHKIDLDGIPMEEIVVLEPLALSVPDVSLDSRPMAGNVDWNPLEHAVPEEDQTSRPMEGVTGPEPLGHSSMKVHLDSQPGGNEWKRSEHPVPDSTPRRVVGFYDNQTVSEPLEHSNTGRSDDLAT